MSIRSWTPFLVAAGLAAGLVSASALWMVRAARFQTLPSMSDGELATATFRCEPFRRWTYGVDVTRADGAAGHISLTPMPGNGLVLRFRVVGRPGEHKVVGVVGSDTGAFRAGPAFADHTGGMAYVAWGRIRGPALVDGVPSVYLTATVREMIPESPDGTGRVVRRWSGVLRATGRASSARRASTRLLTGRIG